LAANGSVDRATSASLAYVNETGAVFVREPSDDGGTTYEYYPAGTVLANATTARNATDAFFRTLANASLTYRGTGNVSRFAVTLVVAPEGFVRYVNVTVGMESGGVAAEFQLTRAFTRIGETTVPTPEWLDRARENPRRSLFGDDRVGIEPTERFHNPRLERWRAGAVAWYVFPGNATSREVRITIHYDDDGVPGPESNLTAAAWDREREAFVGPVDDENAG
jgi:hypothetical protein